MSESETLGAGIRALAARLEARVVSNGQSLESLLPAADSLEARDRALLRALLAGSLRWHHRLDWQLSALLTRPLKRRDAILASLLRIGLFQLQWLRVPDHAAVSATVAATAELGLSRARGLVNAVLRRFLRERDEFDARMRSDEQALTSHPQWLIDAIRRDRPEDWQAVLEANNQAPPMWLRVNRLRTDRERYLARLEAEERAATVSTRLPDAILLEVPSPAASLPGFEAGEVSVQDAAAQYAVELIDPKPGMRVLDACAAPGGKAAHLLERCPDIGELIALDLDSARLQTVRDLLDRLGLDARLVQADAGDVSSWWDGEPFDRILIDAPCSATGVIRRHPDIKLLRRPDDIERSVAAQALLLEKLWPLLKPGGHAVYATCSVLDRENLSQIQAFAARHADAEVPDPGSAGHFQILPGEANMDGFYYAELRKGVGLE